MISKGGAEQELGHYLGSKENIVLKVFDIENFWNLEIVIGS